MNEQNIIDIAVKSIWLTMQVAAPALISALIAGLVVSIFQAATQINEQTMSFIPKIFVMFGALVFCGPWIIKILVEFTVGLYSQIPSFSP